MAKDERGCITPAEAPSCTDTCTLCSAQACNNKGYN